MHCNSPCAQSLLDGTAWAAEGADSAGNSPVMLHKDALMGVVDTWHNLSLRCARPLCTPCLTWPAAGLQSAAPHCLPLVVPQLRQGVSAQPRSQLSEASHGGEDSQCRPAHSSLRLFMAARTLSAELLKALRHHVAAASVDPAVACFPGRHSRRLPTDRPCTAAA